MRKVLRYRYYCEHCNKGGGSGGHIKRHESACTKNPARECRMCKMIKQEQPSLPALIALLPDPATHKRPETDDRGREVFHHWEGLEDAMAIALPKLREASGNCPACIMAALRQRGIPVPEVTEFKFTDECKAIWATINAAEYEASNGYYY